MHILYYDNFEEMAYFDEAQLFPKARQAIKHLVKDGRYHYIETGSLISIKKNVKNILIPLEEMKIQVYPIDYEEFCAATGKLSAIYHSVPAQLSKDLNSYKLYIADTGLFITLMFIDRPVTENEIYAKLLSDKLSANLGYLYESLIAQMITVSGRELYYHTWEKNEITHYYEIDFLISQGAKISAIEVKSSGTGKHESLTEFSKKYSKHIKESFILSQKDIGKDGDIKYIPIYLTSFLCK